MLSANIVNMLNAQMNLEFYSSNLYLQMSAWCRYQGFEGAAAFLRKHADEELQHMRKLFTYLNETGSTARLAKIAAVPHQFNGLKEVFELAYQHEKKITAKINELVSATFEEKDYSSFQFLQWYVAEQHEEETLFNSFLDKLNLLGSDHRGLYHFDQDLSTNTDQ